ncbi:uncharacterized protein LOC142986469 [Anticarsia gemmatalis]|uniref:uncharacterized protein LOC142986469 n=1 Tax=Anticarsia gemmatalis TaxID=129554 RepID=UPI003F75B19B
MPHRLIKGIDGDLREGYVGSLGYIREDPDAVTLCQVKCAQRIAKTIQREQENYLTRHPEIIAMLKLFVAKKKQTYLKNVVVDMGNYFTRPVEEIDKEVRQFLDSPPNGPYVSEQKEVFNDIDLYPDIVDIIRYYYPPGPLEVRLEQDSLYTTSSSFASARTSSTTLPTPEPIPTPPLTTSQVFSTLISNTVDKAFFSRVTEEALKYDTAYVEIKKAVEEAMEITVVEIKEDIAELYHTAYQMFELDIQEKERIAASIAWEKRMRKKLKKTLRKQKNFKGYETPPSKSELSSHPSYAIPMPRPCPCLNLGSYNRYPKDRFGIYLPNENKFNKETITVTPILPGTGEPVVIERDAKRNKRNID